MQADSLELVGKMDVAQQLTECHRGVCQYLLDVVRLRQKLFFFSRTFFIGRDNVFR